MVAAVATFAAISCTQELDNNIPEANGESVVFTAYADGADETKTTLNTTGDKPVSEWTSGDRIWILNGKEGNTGWKKGYSTTDNGAKATFIQEETYDLEGTQYFAVYPAEAAGDATWEGGDKDINGVVLNSNQNATAGSYDRAAHIAVAKSNTASLSFKNAVSLLKFTVKNEGVKSVTVCANEGGLLTGSCNVSAEGNVTPWTGKDEANGWVELSAGEGTFEVGAEYYIAVFPNTLTSGFTVEFSFVGLPKLPVKSYNKSLTLVRNQILNLGELEYIEPDPITINLVPGQWGSDNAWFAVAYNNGVYKMDIDDDGYYTYELPGYVKAFAFWRMNPTSDDLTETNRWNEIADVAVPTDEDNYYIWESWDVAPYGAWGPKPAEKTYSIVGNFNNWGETPDIQMEKVSAGLYAARSVTQLTAFTDWKIRVNGAWDESYSSNITGIEANRWVPADGSGNTSIAADGTYDIYFDAKQHRIYVMTSGTDYATATEQTVSTTPPPAGTPAKPGYLYLKLNSNWKSAGRYAAYFFGNGETWVDMSDPDGDGIYEVAKPTNKNYPSVIFCRMNSGTSANNWDNKWDQTKDLTVPTNGNNLYTIADGAWSKGDGSWSKQETF